jgi:hypothetical protein
VNVLVALEFNVVGLPVLFQQTPLSIKLIAASVSTYPPQVAVLFDISVTSSVDTSGLLSIVATATWSAYEIPVDGNTAYALI